MAQNFEFKTDFIKTGLTAFIGSLDRLLDPYANTLNGKVFPIFINNSGDEVYMSNMSHHGDKGKDLYTRTPRLPLSVKSITVEPEEFTAPGIEGILTVKSNGRDVQAQSHLRRIPLLIAVSGEIVVSKVHELLSFVEMYLMLTSHAGLGCQFTHAGNVHTLVFNQVFDYEAAINFAMSFDSEKREMRFPISFEVRMQFPAWNLFKSEGFNYTEQPGVTVATGSENVLDDDALCDDQCMKCSTCQSAVEQSGMQKIIHNMYTATNENDKPKFISRTVIPQTNE